MLCASDNQTKCPQKKQKKQANAPCDILGQLGGVRRVKLHVKLSFKWPLATNNDMTVSYRFLSPADACPLPARLIQPLRPAAVLPPVPSDRWRSCDAARCSLPLSKGAAPF